MASLVIAEHDNKTLKDATAKTVAAANELGAPVHVLVAGADCGAVAEAAAKLAGVEKVLVADDAQYAKMVAEPMEALILSLADGYDAILAPATTNGKNYMPRVAAKLDVPQISEILAVESADTFTPPDLCRQRHRNRAGRRGQEGHHRAHHRFQSGGRRRLGRGRNRERGRRSGHLQIRRRRAFQVRPPRTDIAPRS